MKTLLLYLYIFIPVICISQTIIVGKSSDVTDAGEGDLYKDTDNIIYIGLTDGRLEQITQNGNVWKNINGNNATHLDTSIGFDNGNVGVGLTNPDNSAILELSSTSQGFLLPRMTKNQMDLILNPTEGLIVYCSDCACKGFQYFDGTDWKDFKCESTASFSFGCSTPAILERSFSLNTGETLYAQVQIIGIVNGNVTLNAFSGNGFTINPQTLSIVANLTQTINIPISYNGNGTVGDYSISLTSDNGINSCQVNVSVIEFDGVTDNGAAPSCKDLLAEFPNLGNGVYWIDPDGLNTGEDPIQCNCDMINGGWTLLDGFSDNNNSSEYTNAMGNVNISNKTELSDSGYTFNANILINPSTNNLNEYLSFKLLWANSYIKKKLPIRFNEVRVLYGRNYWAGSVNVLVNNVKVSSLPSSNTQYNVYEGTYNSNEYIRIEERDNCVGAVNSIWVK